MRTRVRRWRLAMWVIVLAVAVSAVPVRLLAQEKSPPAAQPGIQASIQKAIAATPSVATRVRAVRTQGGEATTGKGSFFKTPAGIAVIAVLAAGTAYGFYSLHHDRIHSVAR